MQKGQIALGIGALILVLALYFGGNTLKNKDKKAVTAAQQQDGISFEQYEQQQIAKLPEAEKTQEEAVIKAIKGTTEQDTAARKKLYLQLSDFWKQHSSMAMSAYYFYQFAQTEGTKPALENAGDVLVSVYKSNTDTIILNKLITFALRSYEEAVKKDSSDVGLQIKLADAYVQGSPEPMKGIGMMKDLEHKHPDNIQVQIALGRLSIQSGQLDKAKERFKKVLQTAPQNTEALYFMAITEAQLGHTNEAIRLFEMCKMIVNDKGFSKEIDDIVKSLKK